MSKIGYLAARILKMNYRELFATVRLCRKKSGKSALWLFRDIVRCGLKYGAGYSDYRLCEMYDVPEENRKTYVTRGINNRLVQKLNDKSAVWQLEDKREFNRLFTELLGRDWLDLNEADAETFARFCEGKSFLIVKPVSAMCGVGVRKIAVPPAQERATLYEELKSSGSTLAEDCLAQHEEMNRLYPSAVNTVRVVTVLTDKAHTVYAYQRMGNRGAVVDNINAGGLTAPVNLETGTLDFPAYDKNGRVYDVHPETGTPVKGFRIPMWDRIPALCENAAARVPKVRYVGWDVAVTPDGPVLIEANHFPGHDFLQMPPHVPDKIGMLPRFLEFVSLD